MFLRSSHFLISRWIRLQTSPLNSRSRVHRTSAEDPSLRMHGVHLLGAHGISSFTASTGGKGPNAGRPTHKIQPEEDLRHTCRYLCTWHATWTGMIASQGAQCKQRTLSRVQARNQRMCTNCVICNRFHSSGRLALIAVHPK